ncbi:MAG: DNA polymerase III subunit gamma/tau [Gammaproteobacteria bacterium]
MSYQVLARKWRPRSFAEVIGQGHVLKALTNALDGDRLHHAYLFTGTRGVGKTTLERVFAKALNSERGVSSTPCGECAACQEIDGGRFVDLIEVDAASRTKVDETRELLDNVPYAPTRARYKVYLIDEVHMFSNHSFNALLKTLEEPPPHVKFLLATTDPKKLPVTILSRCLQFNLTRLSVAQLAEHLAHVLAAEAVPFEAPALTLVAQAAAGSVRDALSLLDQAIAHGGGRVDTAEVATMLGTIDQDRVLALVETLAGGDGRALVERARDLAAYVPDYAQVLAEMLALLRRIAVVHALGDGAAEVEDDPRVVALAARIAADECQLYYQIALTGRRDLQYAPDMEAGFEMTLLRLLAFRPASPPPAAQGPPSTEATSRGSRPARVGERGGERASPTPTPTSSPAAEMSVAQPAERTVVDAVAGNAPVDEPPPAPLPHVEAAPEAAPARVMPPSPSVPARPVPGADADGETAALAIDAPALDWTVTVDSLAIVGLARELARNSALTGCAGDVLHLAIAPQFDRLAQRRHIETLEAALAAHLGRAVRLDVRVTDDATLQTPTQQRSAEAAARQREAEAAIDGDPNVRVLRDTFDAVVEEVSAR